MAVHVGEAVAAALEAVGELLVVDAEEMQDRRVQVVDVHRVAPVGGKRSEPTNNAAANAMIGKCMA